MTNPRTLLLSIAATACCFILTLAGIGAPSPIAPTPAVAALTATGLGSGVTQDASHFDPVTSGPTWSRPPTVLPARAGPVGVTTAQTPRFMVQHDSLDHTVSGEEPLVARTRR
jgi:hypothetical protein